MKGQLALRRIALVLAAMCVGLAGWYLWLRPTTLMIAVGPERSSQRDYIEVIARLMKETKQPFRLKLVLVAGTAEASDALDSAKADIAVVRSDDLTSKDARSIVIIHKRAVVLVTRNDVGIASLREIAGKKIAISMADSDSFKEVLQRILSHYDIDEDDVTLEEMPRDKIAEAMAEKRIDGFILVANPASKPSRILLSEITGEREVPVILSGTPAHEALAFRFKELQTFEVPEGVFGGNPQLPEEDVNTVAITYEIAATSRLSERDATALTKSLMELRPRLRASPESTYSIETPPVDEPRGIVAHAGTAALVNNEVKSWLDTYSEYLWLGMFALGIVGSGVAAVMSWAGLSKEAPADVLSAKMRGLAARLEVAETPREVDSIQGDFDDLMLEIMRDQGLPSLGQEGQSDPSTWLHTFAGLIDRRRALLDAITREAAHA
jgi:TRAP-type uncharacterized transport system substrate-binding protein